jgi:hypothetical protein
MAPKGEVMKSKKRLVSIVSALIIVGGSGYLVMAGELSNNPSQSSLPRIIQADTREVLSGLKGINVVVEYFDPEFEKKGILTKEQIQTDVELELRKFGVKVLSDKESLQEYGSPYLYIRTTFFINSYSPFSGVIEVALNEKVKLIRQSGWIVVGASTWAKVKGFKNYEANDVRELIKEQVDVFINDYLAANPKEQASVKDANDSSKH